MMTKTAKPEALSRNSKEPNIPKPRPHQVRDRKPRKMDDRTERAAQRDRDWSDDDQNQE